MTHDPIAIVDEGLGNSSYVVDLGDGRALVVDPARQPQSYMAAAAGQGLALAYALETHLHADFVSGARELGALGAELLVPGAGRHGFPVRGLEDGEEVDLGGLALRALATPGHTPEHLSYLLLDGRRPVALFSGGSLLVESVARTDLIAPDQTETLARALWRSLHERILTLPDDLPVYPTHGAGSFCSAPTGGERTTTIGRERRANPFLSAPDEDAFVKQLLGGLGSYPPYFLRLREVNRRGPRMYGSAEPTLRPLGVDDVRRHLGNGAWVIDVRRVDAFADRHLPGSVSIALRPQFASWLGWLVPDDTPLVFVLDADQDRGDLVRQARNIGHERLLGELDGGIDTWVGAGLDVERTRLVPVERAVGEVVDVRQLDEYRAGHLPSAIHLELGDVASANLPPGSLSLMCGHGERAMSGASVLTRAGHTDVAVLIGGPDDWSRAHGRLAVGP